MYYELDPEKIVFTEKPFLFSTLIVDIDNNEDFGSLVLP